MSLITLCLQCDFYHCPMSSKDYTCLHTILDVKMPSVLYIDVHIRKEYLLITTAKKGLLKLRTLPKTCEVLPKVVQFHLFILNWFWHSSIPMRAPLATTCNQRVKKEYFVLFRLDRKYRVWKKTYDQLILTFSPSLGWAAKPTSCDLNLRSNVERG